MSRGDRSAGAGNRAGRSEGPRRPGSRESGGITFGSRELLDLVIAWVALSVAFAIFVGRPERLLDDPGWALGLLVICALSVGVGFMLHELAHKVVATRFGQVAAFRADYGMLAFAVLAAIGGFIFAAPGAVHHVGRITKRENGLIALAGPVTNLLLVVAFAPLLALSGLAWTLGAFGVLINAFLAAFNMIPFGPLDGKTVYSWNPAVFAVVFVVSVVATIGLFLEIGFPLPA